MEVTTKENYMQYITNIYVPYRDKNFKTLNDVNKFQRNLKLKEFYDMTIKSSNATVRSLKYFNSNGMKYYGNAIENYERLLMIACETYIFKLYMDSQIELNSYIGKANKISDNIVKSVRFKLTKKHSALIRKITHKNFDFKKYYEDIQYHLSNFYNIGDKIDDFDPDKNIYEALETYLPILLKNINSGYIIKGKDDYELQKLKYKLFHSEVVLIIKSLLKLKKYDEIRKVCDLEVKLLNEDLKRYTTTKQLKKEIKL